jgi:hypothetical protein
MNSEISLKDVGKLTVNLRSIILFLYNFFIMDYKPYSMEWSRRRYLAEAIQQYFDTDASLDVVLDDIVSVLEENVKHHKSRAERFQEVLDGLKSLPY